MAWGWGPADLINVTRGLLAQPELYPAAELRGLPGLVEYRLPVVEGATDRRRGSGANDNSHAIK